MKEKGTGDLSEELMTQANLDAYLSDNELFFTGGEIAPLLTGLLRRKGISKAELARKANMSEVYLHQVFSGRRKPSRDRLLCLCMGLGASLEETQELLKKTGYAQLYPRLKRDAILSHGIIHGTPLNEVNDKLFAENEKALY